MNMDKLWKELTRIERKNGVRVENYGDNFEFHRLKDDRVVYMNDVGLKRITGGKINKQSAQAVMKYVKSSY